jgi:hypothetical protein
MMNTINQTTRQTPVQNVPERNREGREAQDRAEQDAAGFSSAMRKKQNAPGLRLGVSSSGALPGKAAQEETARAETAFFGTAQGKTARRDVPFYRDGHAAADAAQGKTARKEAPSSEIRGKDAKIPPGIPPGESILMGMQHAASQQAVSGNAPPLVRAPLQAENPARPGGELLSRLADRILVSAADASGPREVRVSLREDVLPGTEIRIRRQPDGNVSVRFVTSDIRSEQLLGANQLTELRDVLARNLQVEVRVTTVRADGAMIADSGMSEEPDGFGPSDGSGEGRGGQPHDGRSRQRDIFEGLRENG